MGMICLFFWKFNILLDERQFSYFIVPISNLLFKVVFHHRATPSGAFFFERKPYFETFKNNKKPENLSMIMFCGSVLIKVYDVLRIRAN